MRENNITNHNTRNVIIYVFLGLLLFSFLFIDNINAQNGTTPISLTKGSPAGSYSLSNFETINPYTGNLSFSLPLVQATGRGDSITIPLNIEQKWHTETSSPYPYSTIYYYPENRWWNELFSSNNVVFPGFIHVRQTGSEDNYCSWGGGFTTFRKTLTRLTFTAPDGTEYELRDQLTGGAPIDIPNCNQTLPSRGTVFVTADGSSATFIADDTIYDQIYYGDETIGTISGNMLMRDGTRYRIDVGKVSEIRDRNGNKITFTYNQNRVTKITDSLNREIIFEYDVNDTTLSSEGTPYGLCDRISYKGFGGATRIIRIGRDNLGNLLRSGYSLKTFSQLFPFTTDPNYTNVTYNEVKKSSVWLPDGRRYKLRYNSHGELARVELPTGGVIEYDWVEAINLGSGDITGTDPNTYRRVVERRVYTDGVNLESKMTLSGAESISGIQGYVLQDQYDANNNLLTRTKHYYYGISGYAPGTFYSGWKDGKEYQTDIISNDGNTLLRRTTQTWEQTPPGWWTASADTAPVNNPKVTETTLTLCDTNQVSKQTFTYDQFNNRIDTYEYDYGTGAAGALLRRTHTDYVTDTNYTSYTGSHLRSLPSQTWVSSDANGNNKVSLTQYEYDNYSNDSLHAALVNRSNISGLDSSFTTNYTKRGNVTKVTSYADAQNAIGAISAATQYDIAGNVVKVIDARGNASTIDYTDRFGAPDAEARNNSAPSLLNGQSSFAFATSATNALGFTTYSQFDYSTGKPVDAEDINGTAGTAFYNDVLDRQTQVITANNVSSLKSQMTIAYDDINHITTVTSDLRSFGDNLLKAQTLYDGLGRTTESRKYETVSNYVATRQTYDALDREYQSSNPFRPHLNETPVCTTMAYDALSRVVSVTTPDNLVVYKSYNGNQTTITDQAGKKRRGIADALGRTVKVIEDPTGSLNYETTYIFDAANNLRMTTQGDQKRYFIYDSLERLLRSKNPEQDANTNLSSLTDSITNNSQWADSFTYDANGNILTKTNARNITATMTYDSLNRPLTRNYSDSTTPAITFTYDSTSVVNSKGKLTSISSNVSTSNVTGFDEVGRITSSRQLTPGLENCSGTNQYCTMSYSYDLAGNLISQTYPSGRVITNKVDDVGRLSSVMSQEINQSAKIHLNNITYTSVGAVDRLRLGNGRWESFQYNNRLQVTQIALGASIGDKSLLKIDYSYGTDNNGSLKQQTIRVSGMAYPIIQTYTYDELNRVKSSQETTNGTQSWKQTFNYDRFGNRSFDMNNTTTPKSGQNQNIVNPSINTANNRFNTGQGYFYDAAGNVTQDPQDQSYIYNADNMQTEVKTTSTGTTKARYEYDGSGRRVKKIVGNQETIFVYDAAGQLVAEYQTNYQSGNTRTGYLTSDHLGSPRAIADSTGAVVSRHDYMAFGEEIQAGVGGRSSSQKYVDDNIRQQYTGYERDDESGLDYAQARYYSNQHGRFTSVDPLMASATIRNPQTLNRYSYALNSPYKFTDPLGLIVTVGGGVVDPALQDDKNRNVVPPKDLIDDASKPTRPGTAPNGDVTVQVPDNLRKALGEFAKKVYQGNFTLLLKDLSNKKHGSAIPQTAQSTEGGSNTETQSKEKGGGITISKDPSITGNVKESEGASTTGQGSTTVNSTINSIQAEANAFDVEVATEANNIVNTFAGTKVTYTTENGKTLVGPITKDFVRGVVNDVQLKATVGGLLDALDSFSSLQPKSKK